MTAVGCGFEPLTLLQPAEASPGLACRVISALQLTEAAEKPQCLTNEVDMVQSTNSVPVARTHVGGSHKQSASSAAGSYMNDLDLHLQKHVSCRQLKAQIGSVDVTEARVAGSYGRADGGKHREQAVTVGAGTTECGNMRLRTGCCDKRTESSVWSPCSVFPKSAISAFE